MNKNQEQIQQAVEDTLRARVNNGSQSRNHETETAYLAGACAALQAVFGTGSARQDALTDYIPPLWIIGPMTGRSILQD